MKPMIPACYYPVKIESDSSLVIERKWSSVLIQWNIYLHKNRVMREVGANLGIPVYVFGPETHMTAVVGMALGKRTIPKELAVEFSTANFLLPGGQEEVTSPFSSVTRELDLLMIDIGTQVSIRKKCYFGSQTWDTKSVPKM